jgi:hypothetical protein
MHLKDLRAALPSFYKARNTVQIIGAPGMGKTETVDAFGADMSKILNQPFGIVTQILSGMDPVDIRGIGIPMRSDDGKNAEVRFSKPSVWPSKYNCEVYVNGKLLPPTESREHCEQHGIPKCGALFLDEFSQADTDIQKVSAQIMLDRRIGEHTLDEGWMVITAGNRVEDRAGVTKTLSHVQNRMFTIEIDPDYEAWQAWAFEKGIHPLTIGFAKAHAGDVFRLSVPKEPGPYCTPRSLVMCTRNLEALRTPGMREIELPDTHVAAEVIRGWLGEGVMPKFISHVRLANDLPDVDDIVRRPDDVKVPDRLDARFVMATSLSVHAKDKEKLKPILKYMTRMDVELQTLFVQSVTLRNPHALMVAEFSQWVHRNQKLILAANG